MVGVMAVMVTSFKRTYASTVPLTLQQVMVNPRLHQRLLDTHRQVWLSLLGGVTTPFSWVLVSTRLCLCPPRLCLPSPVEVL